MKYFQSKFSKLLIIVISSFVLSGCVPSVGQGKAKPKDAGEFVKGGVVAGFPPLPLYKDAKVVESYGSKSGFGAVFTTSDEFAKVVNFYASAFTPLGWEAQARKKSDTNYVFDVKNTKYEGSVIVNTAVDNKTTAITIAVSPR